jgi:hypothetical protein
MSRVSVCALTLAALASVALACGPPPPAALYTLSDPVTHGNLTVFFLHAKDSLGGTKVLTLDEAMAAKKVIVHETNNVQQLAVENVGDVAVFVQAGDIVKGGQQDRTLAIDLLLPAKSGKVPLPSFCVERGRWSNRGKEDGKAFAASPYALTDNRLKLACRIAKDQGEVWKEVANAQKELGDKLKGEVRSAASATSLQLTLENKKVQEAVESYIKALEKAPRGGKDVVGVVVAINGKINNADAFGSAELFTKLWPKLLRASAVEAAMSRKDGAKFDAPTKAAGQAFLTSLVGCKSSEAKTTAGHHEGIKESKSSVLFQTWAAGGTLLRNSYIAK